MAIFSSFSVCDVVFKDKTVLPIFLLLTQINVNKFRCVAVNKDVLHVTVAKTNHITNYRETNYDKPELQQHSRSVISTLRRISCNL